MDRSGLVDNVTTYMSSCLVSIRGVLDTTTATAAFFFGITLGILAVYRYITKPTPLGTALPFPKTDPNDITSLHPPSRRHVLPAFGKIRGTLTGDVSTTGISVPVPEIRRIVGTYSNYAVLSGVPHPRPCPLVFVLDKARFRP